MKRQKKACDALMWNEATMRDEMSHPCVDCSQQCERCGWNPAERKRRFLYGRFITNARGGRTLVFPRV